MSLQLDAKTPVCGVLMCKQSNTSTGFAGTISKMSVFKTVNPGHNDGKESGDILATLTSENPSVLRMSDELKVEGHLEASEATLRVEMFSEEDCLAQFTCQVRTVDSDGRELVHTNSLQQDGKKLGSRPVSGAVKLGETLQVPLLLQQLDTKLAMLGNSLEGKLSALENRFEDKILSLHDDVQSLKSEIESKIETRVVDKLYKLGNKLSTSQASPKMLSSSVPADLSELITLEQENQNRLGNLSEKVNDILTNSQTFYQHIGSDIKRLDMTAQSKSAETLSSVRDIFSGVNATIQSTLQSNLEEFFSPTECKKGMASLKTPSHFPYPVVRPSGTVGLTSPYLCDTLTAGGGWIVIQRRTSGDVDFYRDWNSYMTGFGSLSADFWLGNENIYLLSSSGKYELRIEMRYKGESRFAQYSAFSVDSEKEGYALHLGEYSGTAGDSLSGHSGKKFSTYDLVGGGCAKTFTGAWWYTNCHSVNLNGQWGALNNKGPRWALFTGTEPVSFSEMKIRRV